MLLFEIIVKDIIFSAIVAIGFALIFETPRKALWVAGLLGGLGHCIRFLLFNYIGFGLVTSTMIASILIGLSGLFFAHRIHTPPVVFTLPACITMIPGLFAYRTMLGVLHIYEAGNNGGTSTAGIIQETIYNFILTGSLLFCLAIGISVAMLLFRKKSVKEIKFGMGKKRLEKVQDKK